MTTFAHKVRTAIGSPGSIRPFVDVTATKAGKLVRKGEYARTVGYLVETITGSNPYYRYRRRRASDRFVAAEIRGHRMYLDLEDPGISKTLLSYGVHEQLSADAFSRELESIGADRDDAVVLDIGANIGYYSLAAADALGAGAQIFAFEPVRENAALLERNVQANAYDDRIEIVPRAIADRSGTVEMHRSIASNHNTLRRPSGTPDDGRVAESGPADGPESGPTAAETAAAPEMRSDGIGIESVDDAPDREADGCTRERSLVDSVTVDGFLRDREIAPSDVTVVRMDLEGYEDVVFAELSPVLEAPGPTVIHVELHPMYLSNEAKHAIVDALEGFSLPSVVLHEAALDVHGQRRWHGFDTDVGTPQGLESLLFSTNHSIEVLARKPE